MSDPVAQPPTEVLALAFTGRPDQASTYARGFQPVVLQTISTIVLTHTQEMNRAHPPREFVHLVTEGVAAGLERLAAFIRAVDRELQPTTSISDGQMMARIKALEAQYLDGTALAPPSGCVADSD